MFAIAPPAAFGSLYKTTTPEALDAILRELDLASLEQEHFRLERAIQALVKSNKEIQEFIELEQQEQEGSVSEPDPEFVLAIEENVHVIRKYETTCVALKRIIQEKRGSLDGEEGSCSSLGPAGLGSVAEPGSSAAAETTRTTTSATTTTTSATATTATATTATTTTSEADHDDDGVYL